MSRIKKQAIIAFCVLITLLGIIGSAIVVIDGPYKITAMDGVDIANQLALNWSRNATLISVQMGESDFNDGYCTAWYYGYIDSLVVSNKTKGIGIKVKSNGQTQIIGPTEISQTELELGLLKPIVNWSIDSDIAYEHIKNNSTVDAYLTKYRPNVASFILVSGTPNNIPIWKMNYDDRSTASNNEEYHRLWVGVNATTGEILYAVTDQSDIPM